MTHICGKHLSRCTCDTVMETLRDLIASDYIYVGNIVDARIRDGLNEREDFKGLNIYHPYNGPVSPPYPKQDEASS